MAKMMKPRFKESRRLGLNVCGHPKAEKRMNKGLGRDDKKLTEYGTQLLEKQRLRAYYGVMEKQFRTYFKKALKDKGTTGEALVKILETRLDNLVYRCGFASTVRQARQMVVHGHIEVNGRKVDIPSYQVQVGDKISLREKSRKTEMFKSNYEERMLNQLPYITKEDDFIAVLSRQPERSEIPIEIKDSLVVEYYSRYVK